MTVGVLPVSQLCFTADRREKFEGTNLFLRLQPRRGLQSHHPNYLEVQKNLGLASADLCVFSVNLCEKRVGLFTYRLKNIKKSQQGIY